MRNQKGMAERFIEAMQNTGDIMLRYQFQKDMFKSQLLSDNMLDRIADKVLARIAVKTDIMQACKWYNKVYRISPIKYTGFRHKVYKFSP